MERLHFAHQFHPVVAYGDAIGNDAFELQRMFWSSGVRSDLFAWEAKPEVRALAASGATVGLCPLTEASLGDGIFAGADYLAAGGAFGIGTDSNIQIDAAAELRQLRIALRSGCTRTVGGARMESSRTDWYGGLSMHGLLG